MSEGKDINELKAKAYDLGVKLQKLNNEGNLVIEQIKKVNVEIAKAEKAK